MQLTGTVVSVSLNTKAEKQSGGTYDAWELVFRDGSGKIASIVKPVQGLKFNAELKKGLSELQPGDVFTAVLEKNEKGFNDVKSVVKGEYVPSMSNASTPSTPARRGTVTGSNYETPEEREWNRTRIVRQSCLNYAINILKTEKSSPSLDDVLKLAVQLEAFVNNKPEKEVE